MAFDPIPDVPLLGFRKDRIGARIIGLLNTIRLAEDFGVEARFIWLSDPQGTYPELVDPCQFLAPDFVSRHIAMTDQLPDFSGRENLAAEFARMSHDHLAVSLKKGRRYHSDAAFDIVRMIDESPTIVRDRIAEIMSNLPLSTRLAHSLDKAREQLRLRGDGKPPVAIHVRRGDLLDGHPWSYSSWPGKYVPDEFYRAWVSLQNGPVIAFSDSPSAVVHMAQGNEQILLASDLLKTNALSIAERDMLELVLMSECSQVGAPSSSAFSRATAIVGKAQIHALPKDLPEEVANAAHDALLKRVSHQPSSFHAPGDLAQSMQYASNHAIQLGQAAAFTAATSDRENLSSAHPFVSRILATTALAAGQHGAALSHAIHALNNPLLQRRDQLLVQQIHDYVELLQRAPDDTGDQASNLFLSEIFQPGRRSGPVIAILSAELLARSTPASVSLMFTPDLYRALTQPEEMGSLSGHEVIQPRDLPAWSYLFDWEELTANTATRTSLLRDYPLGGVLGHIGGRGADVEAMMELAEDLQTPVSPTATEASLIGIYGASLSFHGRYRRALRLHHWLNECRPDDALTQKRLADSCFRLGKFKAGMRYLDRAIELAVRNPLLHLSKARRLAGKARSDEARKHLLIANEIWPELALIDQQRALVERALRDQLDQASSS